MKFNDYLGIIAGVISLFFGFSSFFLYMKVRKLFSMLNEEQLKEAEQIITSQNKKIKIGLIVTVVAGIVSIISLII